MTFGGKVFYLAKPNQPPVSKKVKKPDKMSNTKAQAREYGANVLLGECKTCEQEIAAEREHFQAEMAQQEKEVQEQMQHHM